MVSFPKPPFSFSFDLQREVDLLLAHKSHREVPEKTSSELLIATWNIANLGQQERAEDHYRLIAEILSWFDIIALQEVHDNLEGLYNLESFIGSEYELLFTDKAGNQERAAYLYDATKVDLLQMVGELAVPPSEHRHIKLPGIRRTFKGFDRNPFIATFSFQNTRFMLINVHLFFGSEAQKDEERRALEAYAVGRYADLRRDDVHSYTPNIIALGDFNIPMAKPGDSIYDALAKRGLSVPEHSTRMGSAIATDAQYDQVAFFPSLKRKVAASGVYDYDGVIFPELWQQSESDFQAYCRYYISDHRPMWVQMKWE